MRLDGGSASSAFLDSSLKDCCLLLNLAITGPSQTAWRPFPRGNARWKEHCMTHSPKFIRWLLTLGLLLFSGVASADAPKVIRMVFPGVGVGNRPVTGGSSVSTMHLKGMLEDEFKPDGIQVTWMPSGLD